MKTKILHLIKMVSRHILYGLLLQVIFLSTLLANDTNAQIKPIDETYLQVDQSEWQILKIIDLVENQTEYRLVFADDQLNADSKIVLKPGRKSVYEILYEISAKTALKFKQVNNTIYVGKMPESKISPEEEVELMAPIKGVVKDVNGAPIPGATVVVEGTTVGTVSDLDGNFSIDVPEGKALLISFIGYESQRIVPGSQTQLSIVLEEDQTSLDEVVVVGYGVQEKLSVTNSLAQVDGEKLERRPVADFQQSLQGLAPGVTVVDQGGRPGNSNINIRIRGITTLGNNNPLIIVDGIEQRLNDINPNDIASVTVLKDASSAAIYGSRAANGVILVTTKRGSEGKIAVSYDGYFALQEVTNRPEHMDLESYFYLENDAYANAGRSIPYTDEYIANYVANAPSPEYPLPFPYWRKDELGMLKTAPQQNHTLSVSGGGEDFSGRFSVRHQAIDGVAPNFSDKLNEFRMNLDLKASEKIKFSGDLNYRTKESLQPAGRSVAGNGESLVFQYMLHASKFSWPKYESGEYGLGPQVNNPLLFAELTGDSRTINDYLTGSVKFEYEILPGLNFSTQYAVRNTHVQVKTFLNKYRNEDPLTGRVAQRAFNSLREYRSNTREGTLNSLLTYNKVLDNHKFTGLLGYSTIEHETNYITGYRQEFYNNDVQSLSQGSNENRDATGVDSEWGLRSYFARLNYNYNDRYFFEVNARYDGSSRFNKDNRYSFFPSFSAGWRLSEESFWSEWKDVINEFKLRGSYGGTGNQAVGLYSFYETLSAINYSFNESPVQGFTQTNLANQNLTWETTYQTNVGFDMGMLEDRVSLTFDYYDKTTDGILLQLPIPALIGLGAPVQNAGVVNNRGYEIGLNFRGGNKLSYDLGLNFSQNKNEVKDLVNSGPYISGGTTAPRFIIQEGMPINSHWGYITDGVFQTQEEVDNYPTLRPNSAPGDVKYVDVNEDGIINENDHQYLGLSFPKFDFGMNGTFTYGNFDLFYQFQGAAGHKTRLDGAFQQIATYETFTHAIYTDNYWTPENPDAEFPRPIKGDPRNFQTSDSQLIDASYLRLKNVVLGYTLPESILEKVSVNSIRVFLGATNLLTFSELNRWDLDPEIPSGRGQYYPQVSMYSLGANVRF
ncbi:TonB-dependent receptor [uncultured Cyclobacterium sp.]|uniref:SusC/RagA family TonB-linked outer membrane protein n=1 Tax=uncultured Cyclobacterium sp. TaxID=453820 RepID=UPI0030EEE0CA|tara:strand:+ start:607545 stop:610907 length:3363 start_codon:yes stop_codon:yes gene_type:complete